ncbi:MAG TPA: hypothetical protein VGG34_12820 [Opitutaceae bacterium]|jgi:hypothetical protein
MIAVAVDDSEKAAASEFFELCKVPWEFFVAGKPYSIVLSTGTHPPVISTDLLLVYSGTPLPFDKTFDTIAHSSGEAVSARSGSNELWIYGNSLTFEGATESLLVAGTRGLPMILARRTNDATVVRIGYDLFREVAHLLSHGQPASNASVPTLEGHIHVLREIVARSGAALVEITPRPAGAEFICCLTHDVDHPILRNHWMDHTMAGFLKRASIGTIFDFLKGRRTLKEMARNLGAVAQLPLLHLGLSEDHWSNFDRYLDLEPGGRSTFFMVPIPNEPGHRSGGSAPMIRGCKYSLEELKAQIGRIASRGGEIGLHGIDSWRCEGDGRRERAILTRTLGSREIGVRMHWLYYDQNSPAALDQAGFTYDSSVGYNETIGFKAGTTQVFKPLSAANLLELPLNIMDTALFYPSYLNLCPHDAQHRINSLIDETNRYGGVLTINWHDRSIFPERLWEPPYRTLLAEMKARGAWFATASMSVGWFRKRRSARIQVKQVGTKELKISCQLEAKDTLPGLRLRLHHPRRRQNAQVLSDESESRFIDFPFNTTTELKVAI